MKEEGRKQWHGKCEEKNHKKKILAEKNQPCQSKGWDLITSRINSGLAEDIPKQNAISLEEMPL